MVKRWEIRSYEDWYTHTEVGSPIESHYEWDGQGPYVLASDYDALEARVKALEAALREITRWKENQLDGIDCARIAEAALAPESPYGG